MSALQAMATYPDYSDFMRTMEQHWPGLLTVALPQITIPIIPATPINSIPNANSARNQPDHPQYGASERISSPSCASTSSQKGGEERRPESRKSHERSPLRPVSPTPQNVRNSP